MHFTQAVSRRPAIPQHLITAPSGETSVTYAISVRSYSGDNAVLPLHSDTSLEPQGATLIFERPPSQRAAMTIQALPRGTPLPGVSRQQALLPKLVNHHIKPREVGIAPGMPHGQR